MSKIFSQQSIDHLEKVCKKKLKKKIKDLYFRKSLAGFVILTGLYQFAIDTKYF